MIQNNSEQTWDVVIIGAGAAGLTASIYLARAGKTVLLLDRGAHSGDRAISTEIAGMSNCIRGWCSFGEEQRGIN